MKLSRIRIEQVRQFRKPFELAGLEPGLNLFTGPNEAGKSTVVRAIRAAFFERHRSSSVDDLVPYGESVASPTVEIDFDIGAEHHRLRKTFLQRKRCELTIGTRQLDGEDAEQHLARLLGYEFSSRGASKAEHWGIPGLLWIEQGAGQDIKAAVGHATPHLQTALGQSVGDIASSQGDEVAARIKADRDALLTTAGKPRGVFSEALAERDRLSADLQALDARIDTYRHQVDQLATLCEEDAADQRTRPWETFRAKLQVAEQALAVAQGLSTQLAAARTALHQHDERVQLLQQQWTGFDQQDKALAQREAAVAAAEEKLVALQAALSERTTQAAAAAERHTAALHTVERAEQEDLRAELLRRASDADAQAATLARTAEEAQAQLTQLAALRSVGIETEIAEAAVRQLREQRQALRELQIWQDAAATRVRFSLTAPGLLLGDEALQGDGERLIAMPTELQMPGIGRLTISPGGSDLAAQAQEEATLRVQHAALLQRLGVADADAAEARLARHKQALADQKQAERALKIFAPQGMDVLIASLDTQRQRGKEAAAQLARLPARPDGEVPSVADARHAQQAARAALDRLGAEAAEAASALRTAQAQAEAEGRERDTLRTLIDDPARAVARADAGSRLAATQAEQAAQRARVEALEREVADANPALLTQDVQRFARSAEQAQRAASERQQRMTHLRGTLEATGAQGLEEARAELATRAQAAERRHAELQLRAQALALVHELIEAKRREATQRLQAPLQKHISHYLKVLFPGATLSLGDDLTPALLTRGNATGAHTAGGTRATFDMLSFGAREQMALISRLAYADLLKEAGRPTLVILDDALVHSDGQRLGEMKRVLYDAAQRHQVLLFTCHPDAWRDLGAMPRPIAITP